MRIPRPAPVASYLRRLAALGILSGIMLVQGCATPTDYRSWERGQPVYYVKGGDTLYSIAVANDIDWQRLARWNDISNPRHLKIGQRLRLSAPGSEARAGRSTSPSAASTPVKAAPKAARAEKAEPAASPVTWKWPLEGRVLHRFSDGVPAQKGVILGASIDTPVRAAADGRVVYSGDGLPGYGNLVIVKHNAEWLSAYAYNKSLDVAEGEQVRSGQTIARVGPRDHREPDRGGHLLFQIRRQGKPVDPERYLP